jgi:uncharacterized protein (TIGR04255 family)
MVGVASSRTYRNPPLALALIEVKHPSAPALGRGELAALKAALLKVLPLQSTEARMRVAFQVGPGGGAGSPVSSQTDSVFRFSSRDKRTSVTFGPDSFSIETTAYEGWQHFRELLRLAVNARMDIAPVDGIERIGLRYVDEIRVPDRDATVGPEWVTWVDPSLAAPLPLGLGFPLRPVQQQAVVQYATEMADDTLTLRYGAVFGPPAVGSGPPARAVVPAPGHYFLIDTDAAWTVKAGDDVPVADVTFTLDTADRLHGPVTALFESLLTDKLCKEVLGVE